MTPAKTIAVEGASRERIRVYQEGDLIRVRWRENGKRMTRSWPFSAENKATAKAFAKGIAAGREAQSVTEPLTLRELWTRYSEAEFPNLRAKTQKLYAEYFSRWETMWGRDFIAENTTIDMAIQCRAALRKQGKAISTIRHSLETVKMVYAWGQVNELLDRNRLALFRWKRGKDTRAPAPPEYTNEEYEKLIAKLLPSKATEWRAWVALTICREQGVRQNSALHLKWDDVDGAAGVITWRAEWDKVGKEWTQPIRQATRTALEIARAHREESPYVLPSGSKKNKGSCYTIGALYLALRGAETRAGIKHLPQRGAHGLRRLLAGDINEATGDPALAMMAIGDDIKQASRYIQKRDNRMREVFEQLDAGRES